MFKWLHEHSFEIDIAVSHVVKFFAELSNWPKWIDQIESCHIENINEDKTTFKAKIKGKDAYIYFISTEIEYNKNYNTVLKTRLFKQESNSNIEEISPNKTKITIKTTVTSFLTPFFTSYFRKKTESQYSKMQQVLLETLKP